MSVQGFYMYSEGDCFVLKLPGRPKIRLNTDFCFLKKHFVPCSDRREGKQTSRSLFKVWQFKMGGGAKGNRFLNGHFSDLHASPRSAPIHHSWETVPGKIPF